MLEEADRKLLKLSEIYKSSRNVDNPKKGFFLKATPKCIKLWLKINMEHS